MGGEDGMCAIETDGHDSGREELFSWTDWKTAALSCISRPMRR